MPADRPETTGLVALLRELAGPRYPDDICGKALMGHAADEIDRLCVEVTSLRLTLGGRTFSGQPVPDPIGCPMPGACAQVAEIERLRAALAKAEAESARLHRLLRRPKVWAAHAADPNVVAPECDCPASSTCRREACCYFGAVVPSNVRDALSPEKSAT